MDSKTLKQQQKVDFSGQFNPDFALLARLRCNSAATNSGSHWESSVVPLQKPSTISVEFLLSEAPEDRRSCRSLMDLTLFGWSDRSRRSGRNRVTPTDFWLPGERPFAR
jgi:hypothetical protein